MFVKMNLPPLSKDSALPLYYQVRESIRHAIATGAIKAGEKMPTEGQLAKMLGVSLITVKRALTDLQLDGLVTKIQGRGTFVRAAPMEQKLDHLSGFAEDMEELHHKHSAKVFAIATVPATEEVCARLAVEPDEQVIKIERVRYADDEPIMFAVAYLSRDLGERLVHEDLEKNAIFSLLEKKYGIVLIEADYQLEAAVAPHYIQKALDLATHAPTLLVRRTAYTENRRPIDFTQLYYRGDRFRYVVGVRRNKTTSRLLTTIRPDSIAISR
jgi:GntR family transcriptional regulator